MEIATGILLGSTYLSKGISISTLLVSESAAVGSTVATLSAPGGSYTFSVTSDKFTVVGNELRVSSPLNYEAATSHTIIVTAGPLVRTFIMQVTNVLEAASLVNLTGTLTLREDAIAGTVSGDIFGKTVGSTILLVNDAGGRVALSGVNIVRGLTPLDYETATSHSITIREILADSQNSPRDSVLTLTVTEVDEVPPAITSSNPSGSFAEGVSVFGTLTANEPVTWSKSGADASLVTLNASSGAWSIPTTDYETKTFYSWTFTATDANNNTTNQVVSIIITDVVENITIATREVDGTVTVSNLETPWTPVLTRQPDGTVLVGV